MGRRWRQLAAGAAACLLGWGGVGAALGNSLAPGALVTGLDGASAAQSPQLAGKVVAEMTTPFRYDGWFVDYDSGRDPTHGEVTGSVLSRVVLSRDGGYDFYWRITVDSGAFLPVAGLLIAGLPPGTYDANWRRDDHQGEVTPAYVSEASDGEVDWRFGQYLPPSQEVYPGQRTYLLYLSSGARHYARNAFFSLVSERDGGGSLQIDWGGSSGLYPTFAPADADQSGGSAKTHASPAALANDVIRHDALLQALPGRRKACIVSHVAGQQSRFGAYGPHGGPYDASAVRAAVHSFASSCP